MIVPTPQSAPQPTAPCILVMFEGNIHRQLGVFRAVVARVKHLRQCLPQGWRVRTVMVQGYDAGLLRLLHGKPSLPQRPDHVTADGVDIEVHWFRHRLLDGAAQRWLDREPPLYTRWLHRLGRKLAVTDGLRVVAAHDRIAAVAAEQAAQSAGVPWFVTWHGASIYTDPPRRPYLRRQTARLLNAATGNIFVSHALQRLAEQLAPGLRGHVLPNGADAAFTPLPPDEREAMRRDTGITDPATKVVAFVGRFEAVKNVDLLPRIFAEIARRHTATPLTFWAIGDGPLRDNVAAELRQHGIECWLPGLLPPDRMPRVMAGIDLLVLPSQLEGLPLVAIEALQSGAHVVATDVVGNAEVVGSDNAIAPTGNDWPERLAARAATMLNGKVEQTLPPDISWPATAQREANLYLNTLSNTPNHSI